VVADYLPCTIFDVTGPGGREENLLPPQNHIRKKKWNKITQIGEDLTNSLLRTFLFDVTGPGGREDYYLLTALS